MRAVHSKHDSLPIKRSARAHAPVQSGRPFFITHSLFGRFLIRITQDNKSNFEAFHKKIGRKQDSSLLDRQLMYPICGLHILVRINAYSQSLVHTQVE